MNGPATITPELRAAAFRAGLDAHELAAQRDVPAVHTPPPPRPVRGRGSLRFTGEQVAKLRAQFAARPAGCTVAEWCELAAAEYGVGHATIRRAVYGFDCYAT